jgi:hypothetical protein
MDNLLANLPARQFQSAAQQQRQRSLQFLDLSLPLSPDLCDRRIKHLLPRQTCVHSVPDYNWRQTDVQRGRLIVELDCGQVGFSRFPYVDRRLPMARLAGSKLRL